MVNRPTLINFLLFQLGWFVCVLGGAWQYPWAGVVYVALATAWHLTQIPNPRGEAVLLACGAAVGLGLDSILPAAGWVTYPSGQFRVGFGNRLSQVLGQLPCQNCSANALTDFVQVGMIGLQLAQRLFQARAQIVVVHEAPVCCGGRREPAGHPDAEFGELSYHFAKRGILAADARTILAAEILQPAYKRFSHGPSPSHFSRSGVPFSGRRLPGSGIGATDGSLRYGRNMAPSVSQLARFPEDGADMTQENR